LRERKKAETRTRIHKEGLRLFERQGFSETTVAEIAAAADVSPRTVFVHYPTKEDIVFGDLETALLALEVGLRSRPRGLSTLEAIRLWVDRSAGGWLEPDVELQVRLAAEVPSIAERKIRVAELFRTRLLEAIAVDLERPPEDLDVQLAASATVAGLLRVEALVSEHLRDEKSLPSRERLDEMFDRIGEFVESGLRGS